MHYSMRLLLDFLCSVAQASGSTAKIDSVWKCSLHCFRHTHGVSFIKRSVDFFLKVYVGTKARFCLRTSFRIYKYAGTCAKNFFIDPSQGKIMHACISSEITICVRDSTRSQSPATYIHPITCRLQLALLHVHTSLRCSTSGLPFSYLN